jgi:ribosomal protein L40E
MIFLLASPDLIHIEIQNSTTMIVQSKCIHILQQTVQILEQFHGILQRICASRQTIPIQQIIRLFPEIEQAEHDLELLKPLLDPTALPQLLSIVSFWRDRSCIHHICMGLMQLSTKFAATSDSTLFGYVCGITEKPSGEECFLIHEEYKNQIEKRFPDTLLTLISYYSTSSDLFDFLHSLTAEDVYNLQEAVNDNDETFGNTKTVFDFAIVKNFIDRADAAVKVKRQELKNTPFTLDHIIACFTTIWKNDQFIDLLKCLDSSSLALSSIKCIHLELTDKEQSKRRKIADILQKSTVYFVRIGHHETTFDVNVELPPQPATINDEKKQQKVTFADLSELRDRARLLEYSSNVNKRNVPAADSERDKERLRNFIQFAGIVESTIEILTTLYMAGHPSVSEFLVQHKTFSCIDGKYEDLQQNNKMLTDLLDRWEKNLCAMYETHIGLTYFSGDQFWQIEDYIYHRSSLSDPGYHLLKFIDINPNSIEQPHKVQQNPDGRLENLGRLLSRQQQLSSRQREIPKIKKCFLVETTNEGVLRAILSLFSLTSTPASVCRIFYCTQQTNWIQVRAFVYRCFYSQSFHQLIRPELLSQSIQDQFIRLLRLMIEQRPHHIFQMGIVTTTTATDQQLINGLQSMQILNILRDHELLNNNDFHATIQRMIHKCQLVTSQITGLGKSSTIRQAIQLSKKNYVKFPICGDFDVDILAERLRSKYSQLQTAAIHLDIGTIGNNQQLNEILYCLLLFGSFRFGQIAVSIPANTSVYIELDASPQSTLAEIPLFQHIQSSEKIVRVDWKTLRVDNLEIQTVVNYLDAIVSGIIMKQNINPSTFKKFDVATSSQLIQKLFLENKNTDYITWTQLSIFVAVFNSLFTGFSRCGHFLCENVPRPELRMDLIQTFLRSSNQFTSLSVEAVRRQQRSVATNESIAFSDTIVRWDKMQPFTLVFTATDDPLFVYKHPDDVPRALVEYFKLYYQATKTGKKTTENEMFPDYNNLIHTQFFIKLASLSRKYFNKAICPKCFRQYEVKEQKCQKCSTEDVLIRPRTFDHDDVSVFQIQISERLQNEYVLTPDNFIKMLLIYMRVQSGIPVLIMGETGKTDFFYDHPT